MLQKLVATEEQITSQNASLAEYIKGIMVRWRAHAQQAGVNAQQVGIRSQRAQLDDQIAHTFVKSPITEQSLRNMPSVASSSL